MNLLIWWYEIVGQCHSVFHKDANQATCAESDAALPDGWRTSCSQQRFTMIIIRPDNKPKAAIAHMVACLING